MELKKLGRKFMGMKTKSTNKKKDQLFKEELELFGDLRHKVRGAILKRIMAKTQCDMICGDGSGKKTIKHVQDCPYLEFINEE